MRILIIDDEAIAITRLQFLLKSFPDTEVVGSARTAEDAIKKIIKIKPDLVLIDVEIGNSTGYEIIQEVDKTGFRPKYIVITAFSQYAIAGIRSKVDDYLLKPVDLSDLKAALERVSKSQTMINRVLDFVSNAQLTTREREVLIGVLDGKTSKEIAQVMNLSKHTVDTYRRKIIKKTGIKSTMELIRKGSYLA